MLNSSSGRSSTSESKLAQFMTSGSFDSGFSLQLMAKDVGLAVALARALGCPVEVAGHAADQWRRLAGGASPATDHTQIYTLPAPPNLVRDQQDATGTRTLARSA